MEVAMNRKNWIVVGVLAGLAAIGISHAVVVAAPDRSRSPYGVTEVCRDLDKYAALKLAVPGLLRLTADQTGAWKSLDGALGDGQGSIDAGCARLGRMPAIGSATAQAARLEVVLATSLDALRKVRPAFERFYGTLDDGQKKQVDSLFERHRI
jgi:hypothetical protein